MKTTKKNLLKLDRETIRVLDDNALANVQGGILNSAWLCVSNNGGGQSCLGYCPKQ